jgi:uncharacterized protein YggE
MRVLCAIALLTVTACFCHGQFSNSSGISVSGDAQVNVVPDRVTIFLGVETRNKDLDLASAQNDSLVRQVLAAARKQAIDTSDIQTDFIHVDLKYEHDDSTVVEHYKVTKEIQVVLKDVSKFESLVAACFTLEPITFTESNSARRNFANIATRRAHWQPRLPSRKPMIWRRLPG